MASELARTAIAIVLAVSMALLAPGWHSRAGAQDSILARNVKSFRSADENLFEAVLRFGRENHVPLGLVIRPRLCSIKTTPINFQNASVQGVLGGLTKQLPSYTWNLEGGTVVLAPSELPPATTAFLQTKVPPYTIAEGSLQAQAAYSWLDIRASLRPAEGTAFNVLSSPESSKWPPLRIGDIRVRQLLDLLVARKTSAAWILPEFADLARAAETRPFSVSDYDVSFERAPDVCANIVAP